MTKIRLNSAIAGNGFTLLEIILSISLIGVLAGLSVPVYNSFQARNDMDNAAGTIAQVLGRAEIIAASGKEDSSWSVKIEPGQLTLFKGVDFFNRDQAFDEILQLPSGISVTGLDEFGFQKFTGSPTVTGTSTITDSSGEARSIGVHPGGMIDH